MLWDAEGLGERLAGSPFLQYCRSGLAPILTLKQGRLHPFITSRTQNDIFFNSVRAKAPHSFVSSWQLSLLPPYGSCDSAAAVALSYRQNHAAPFRGF